MELNNNKTDMSGKYISHKSSFGDNCKLWLNGKSIALHQFYLETGFTGDCGGQRTIYTGEYEIIKDKIKLRITNKAEEEWDDTLDTENRKESKINETLFMKILDHGNNIKFKIRIEGKKYVLFKEEND